jgi:hypothetical protein
MQRVGTTVEGKFSFSVCCMWSDLLSVVVCVFALIYFGFSGSLFLQNWLRLLVLELVQYSCVAIESWRGMYPNTGV